MAKTQKKKSKIDLTASHREAAEKEATPIRVSDLFLDPENPRLAETSHTKSQASIQKVLEKEFDLQPIMDSLYRNGFFWEEPLLAVKEKINEKGNPVHVVIEGNRRLAALKFIHENPARFPDANLRADLEEVPVIVRTDREETLSFVGFRHITGIMPWESAAMAQYALRIVNGGNTIEHVADLIGDTTRKIRRLIRTQSIIEHAKEIGLTPDDAAKKFFFSYLLTATDGTNAQNWLNLKVDDTKGTVSKIDDKNLEKLWSWLYGSKEQQINPVIGESRQISKLTKILSAKEAVKELEKTRNLDRAHALTTSREQYSAEVLSEVRNLLQDLFSTISPDGPLEGKKELSDYLSTSKNEYKKIENILKGIKPLINI